PLGTVDRVDGQPRVDEHIDEFTRGRLLRRAQYALQPEATAVHGAACRAVAGEQVDLEPPQVVGEDRVVRREADGALQGVGVDDLFVPAEPADPTRDVDVDPEVRHGCALRRNHTEASGGTVTLARALKWPQGSASASTAPRLPCWPEPS